MVSTMAVPIPKENIGKWQEWCAEINGARKSQMEDMMRRFDVTHHWATLQQNPDGSAIVIVGSEGEGGPGWMHNLMTSNEEFDNWFKGKVGEIHGMDLSQPPPEMPPPIVGINLKL